MESNCKKIKFRHKNNNTFSKTFIAIGQTIKSTPNQISNKEVAFIVKKSKELNEQAKCNGMQEDVKSDGKHPKVISKELPSTEVSVSLLISRNHNASISASCYFNSKEQQQSLPFPIRKFNNNNNYERNSFPLKTPRRLKIVEIPFEEKQLIKINGKEEIKKREEEFSPYSVPTSPQTNFTWPNFKSSNKSDSTGIGSSLSVSSNNSSNGESDNHFFIQNKSRDYRVISLDEKPCPGRLDDFVPEVERRNEEINRKIVEEKEISKGKNKLEQKFVNFPSLNRAHSTIYGEREINKKWSNESRRKFEKISNGCEIKKGTNSLERDSSGRLIIPSNEWRKFLAEQRPSNVNKINSQLQIVFRRDNYSNL